MKEIKIKSTVCDSLCDLSAYCVVSYFWLSNQYYFAYVLAYLNELAENIKLLACS